MAEPPDSKKQTNALYNGWGLITRGGHTTRWVVAWGTSSWWGGGRGRGGEEEEVGPRADGKGTGIILTTIRGSLSAIIVTTTEVVGETNADSGFLAVRRQ